MKYSGSSNLVPLIDCTKLDEESDFYIIKNKAKDQTQLRDDKDAKTGDEEVFLTMRTAQC